MAMRLRRKGAGFLGYSTDYRRLNLMCVETKRPLGFNITQVAEIFVSEHQHSLKQPDRNFR